MLFFCCAPLGAATFRRGQSKKKHHPGCFFFGSGPGERQGKEKPRWAPARGQSKKKHHPGYFFFCSGPGERQGKEKPRWAPARGQSKKKTPWVVFFFAPAPAKDRGRRNPVGGRHGARAKKNTLGGIFFLLWPRAGAQRGFSFPCLSPGPEQKKTPWVVFFFCSGPVPARGFSFPCLSPGPEQKKKHPGWCFFFAAAPRGRSLTHCRPGWRCLPLAGVVFFFLLRPRPDQAGVFFFAVAPPGRSLTHCGLGRFRQGPGGVFFFLLRPRRVVLDNNKKCLGYYIGSKKTRRGHSKKKNTTSPKTLNPIRL